MFHSTPHIQSLLPDHNTSSDPTLRGWARIDCLLVTQGPLIFVCTCTHLVLDISCDSCFAIDPRLTACALHWTLRQQVRLHLCDQRTINPSEHLWLTNLPTTTHRQLSNLCFWNQRTLKVPPGSSKSLSKPNECLLQPNQRQERI